MPYPDDSAPRPFAIVDLEFAELLEGNPLRLYVVLYKWRNHETNQCRPKRKTIAAKLGCTPKSVTRWAQQLAEVGAITITPQFDNSSRIENIYTVHRHPTAQGVGTDESLDLGTEESLREPDPLEPDLNTTCLEVDAPNKNPKTRADQHFPDARLLCDELADRIHSTGVRRPTITNKWIQDMERLLRLDDRTPEQVRLCLRWIYELGGDFWIPNILSPFKLRQKYDQMQLQAQRLSSKNSTVQAARAIMDPAPEAPFRLTETNQQKELRR